MSLKSDHSYRKQYPLWVNVNCSFEIHVVAKWCWNSLTLMITTVIQVGLELWPFFTAFQRIANALFFGLYCFRVNGYCYNLDTMHRASWRALNLCCLSWSRCTQISDAGYLLSQIPSVCQSDSYRYQTGYKSIHQRWVSLHAMQLCGPVCV